MSGEKVKGEKVCGSSAEGGTHHRCTSGPKKGRAHYFREGIHIFGGGGGRRCLQTIIHQQILFFF